MATSTIPVSTKSRQGAFPSTQGRSRSTIAVSIFLFTHFMQVLGTTLRLPTLVAVWAPAFIVILVGAILLARMDEA